MRSHLKFSRIARFKPIRTETPPKIDGKLDDVCWKNSAKTGELLQFEPQNGEPATQPTTIYLAYDANNLYVAFECFKTDMDKLAANLTRRDSFFFSDDHVEVLIDTFLDGRNCYAFALNPLGTQTDRRLINEGSNRRTGQSMIGTAISWDCDWQGQAAIGTDSWTAEFAIPFAELRFSKGTEIATWGINFWRNDESPAEEQMWADLAGTPVRRLRIRTSHRPPDFRFGHQKTCEVQTVWHTQTTSPATGRW